jgi:biotin operon repressor
MLDDLVLAEALRDTTATYVEIAERLGLTRDEVFSRVRSLRSSGVRVPKRARGGVPRKWLPWQDEYLRQAAADDVPLSQQAERLGRTLDAVSARRGVLGLRDKWAFWTAADEAYLLSNYASLPWRDLEAHLQRPRSAIQRRVSDLRRGGVEVQARKRGDGDSWQACEDAYLIANKNKHPKLLAFDLRRNESTVYRHMRQLSKAGLIDLTERPRWNSGNHYSADEDRLIAAMPNTREASLQVASELGRSFDSVRRRYVRLTGNRLSGGTGRVWGDKAAVVLKMWPTHSAAEIAHRLGCTRCAVSGIVHRLKKRGLLCAKGKRQGRIYTRKPSRQSDATSARAHPSLAGLSNG